MKQGESDLLVKGIYLVVRKAGEGRGTIEGVPLEGMYYAQPGETVIAVFEKK